MANDKKDLIPHDAFVKKLLENPIASREFLEEYLPKSLKQQLDLSKIKIEKESFVEENLKRQLSDIIFSIPTENNEEAYVYTILEHQSTDDYWISLRLWKYMLLLCERHLEGKKKKKLPLIFPMVIYNGTKKYTAPKNLWNLFIDPDLAKELMAEDYKLVDLQAISDDELAKDKHLSLAKYMLKHARDRDIKESVLRALNEFSEAFEIDIKFGSIYTKLMLWYYDSRIPAEEKTAFEKMIIDNLPGGKEVMRSIAHTYIEEGEARGEARGNAIGIKQTAINMLHQKLDMHIISKVTGLSKHDISKLQRESNISDIAG